VPLAPGEARAVRIAIDPRLIASWSGDGWRIAAGRYRFATGRSATELGTPIEVTLRAQRLRP
jgi:beta-glucosidase